jgi:hypothetical protein
VFADRRPPTPRPAGRGRRLGDTLARVADESARAAPLSGRGGSSRPSRASGTARRTPWTNAATDGRLLGSSAPAWAAAERRARRLSVRLVARRQQSGEELAQAGDVVRRPLRRTDRSGGSEPAQHRSTLGVEQDVRRLDGPVHDARPMESGDRGGHREAESRGSLGRQRPVEIRQCAGSDPPGHEVGRIGGTGVVDHLHHARHLDGSQHGRLLDEVLLRSRPRPLDRNEAVALASFDRHLRAHRGSVDEKD